MLSHSFCGSGTCMNSLASKLWLRVSHEVAVKMLPRAVLSEDLTGAEEAASSVAHSYVCWAGGPRFSSGVGRWPQLLTRGPLCRVAAVFSLIWQLASSRVSDMRAGWGIHGTFYVQISVSDTRSHLLCSLLMRSDLQVTLRGGELSPTSAKEDST